MWWLVPLAWAAGAAGQEAPGFRQSIIDVEAGTKLLLADMDGDGAQDLVASNDEAIWVHFLTDGRYAAKPEVRLEWPGSRLGWEVADIEGDGRSELVLLDGGTRVDVRQVTRTQFEKPRELLGGARSYLPLGVWRVGIVRDVDGDGLGDLVLPGPGRFRIHLQRDGAFGEALEVAWREQVRLQVGDPTRMGARIGESVHVPLFDMEDADGDGRTDLVAQDEDRMQVYLADPGLPTEPTWTFDKAALREELQSDQTLNLDDLFSNVPATVNLRLCELDGKAPRDLILQQGGTFKVYLGGSRTGPRRDADQVLKASGNVLYFLVRNVLGDELPELQLIRAEKISLASVVRWLVLPGSLDFDVFSYENEAGAFTRKPSRRNTLSIRIPRLLALEDEFEEIEEGVEERFGIPARLFTEGADGRRDDVVDIDQGRVVVYRDVVPPDFRDRSLLSIKELDVDRMLELLILEELDGLADGATKTISMEDWKDFDITPGHVLREAAAGGTRGRSHALSPSYKEGETLALRVADLDGDGRSDVLVHGPGTESYRVLQVLVLE